MMRLLAYLIVLAWLTAAVAFGQTGYTLVTSVISAGGAPGASALYAGNGSLGQPTPIGVGATASESLHAGFWYQFARTLSPTAVEPIAPLVKGLEQNFPNPFNPQTTIAFTALSREPVRLEIFDLQGQRVRLLLNEERPPGRQQVVWNGRDDGGQTLPSGTYFCRASIGGLSEVRKMLLLK